MVVSDFRINSKVRAVLAKHWIDLQSIRFGSFRGVVRLMGELRRLGGGSSSARDEFQLDVLEGEIKRIRGVKRVYFDLVNWERSATGQWREKGGSHAQRIATTAGDGESYVVEVAEEEETEEEEIRTSRQGAS